MSLMDGQFSLDRRQCSCVEEPQSFSPTALLMMVARSSSDIRLSVALLLEGLLGGESESLLLVDMIRFVLVGR
jgi:hypothetical protein